MLTKAGQAIILELEKSKFFLTKNDDKIFKNKNNKKEREKECLI